MSRASSIRRKDRKSVGGKSCYVCSQYSSITQVHHLVPVGILSSLLEYAEKLCTPLELPYQVVSLCPNHHAMLHMLYDRDLLPVEVEEWERAKLQELALVQLQATKKCVDYAFEVFDAVFEDAQ